MWKGRYISTEPSDFLYRLLNFIKEGQVMLLCTKLI